jgi:hypothetical protein
MELPEVKDFSSLGNQRYLVICQCEGPSNEAVKGFGNVFHLHITSCNNVIEFKNLHGKNNKILTFISCLGLRLLELSEQEYLRVIIRNCSGLDDFKIYGTVYSLDFIHFSEVSIFEWRGERRRRRRSEGVK